MVVVTHSGARNGGKKKNNSLKIYRQVCKVPVNFNALLVGKRLRSKEKFLNEFPTYSSRGQFKVEDNPYKGGRQKESAPIAGPAHPWCSVRKNS